MKSNPAAKKTYQTKFTGSYAGYGMSGLNSYGGYGPMRPM